MSKEFIVDSGDFRNINVFEDINFWGELYQSGELFAGGDGKASAEDLIAESGARTLDVSSLAATNNQDSTDISSLHSQDLSISGELHAQDVANEAAATLAITNEATARTDKDALLDTDISSLTVINTEDSTDISSLHSQDLSISGELHAQDVANEAAATLAITNEATARTDKDALLDTDISSLTVINTEDSTDISSLHSQDLSISGELHAQDVANEAAATLAITNEATARTDKDALLDTDISSLTVINTEDSTDISSLHSQDLSISGELHAQDVANEAAATLAITNEATARTDKDALLDTDISSLTAINTEDSTDISSLHSQDLSISGEFSTDISSLAANEQSLEFEMTTDVTNVLTQTATLFKVDGAIKPNIQLVPGATYRFKQSHISNLGNLLKFSENKDGTHQVGGFEFTNNVTHNGSLNSFPPGFPTTTEFSQTYTEIRIDGSTPSKLYYFSAGQPGCGGEISINHTDDISSLHSQDLSVSGEFSTDISSLTAINTEDSTDISSLHSQDLSISGELHAQDVANEAAATLAITNEATARTDKDALLDTDISSLTAINTEDSTDISSLHSQDLSVSGEFSTDISSLTAINTEDSTDISSLHSQDLSISGELHAQDVANEAAATLAITNEATARTDKDALLDTDISSLTAINTEDSTDISSLHAQDISNSGEFSEDISILSGSLSGAIIDNSFSNASFSTAIPSGVDSHQISFPTPFLNPPQIGANLEVLAGDQDSPIIPFVTSGITSQSYNVLFAQEIPNDQYKINTLFGYSAGGADDSARTMSFTQMLTQGQSDFEIAYPQQLASTPRVGITIENNTSSSIIPFQISGVTNLDFHITFAEDIPSNDYKVHAILENALAPGGGGGGGESLWEEATTVGDIHYTGDVGIGTDTPAAKLDIDAGSNSAQAIQFRGHILPASNSNFDIGSAEYKIRHLFLSDNSLYIGGTNISAGDTLGEIQFPSGIAVTKDSSFIGNVGIGTPSPVEKLEVVGGISFEGSANDVADAGKAILDTNGLGALRLKIHGNNNGAYGGFEFISKKGDGSDPKTVLKIDEVGFVGIGINNPLANLHIKTHEADTPAVLMIDSGDVGYASVISFVSDSERAKIQGNYASGGGGELRFHTDSVEGSNLERMRITSAGNVGIGTTSPSTSLDINKEISETAPIITLSRGGAPKSRFAIANATSAILAGALTDDLCIRTEGGNIRFGTASATKTDLSITSGGDVGIGTTIPGTKLHLTSDSPGTSITSTNPRTITIQDTSLTDDAVSLINFTTSNGYVSSQIGSRAVTNVSGANVRADIFFTTRNSDNTFTEKLTIKQSGYVGIGTTIPSSRLDISGEEPGTNLVATNTGTSIRIRNSSNTDGNFGSLDFYNSTNYITARVGAEFKNAGDRDTALFFATRKNGGSLTQRMTIDEDGNVGIGTTNPGAKLDVIGRIKSDSIVGNNGLSIASGGTGNLNLYHGSFGTTAELGITIVSGGNVGIGTTIPGNYKLNVQGAQEEFIQRISNNHSTSGYCLYLSLLGNHDNQTSEYIRCTTGGGTIVNFKVYSDGTMYADGSFLGSDDRIKHNEEIIVNAVETLSRITPKKYFKTSKLYDANHDFDLDSDGNPVDENGEPVNHRVEAGVIAQEVLGVDELKFTVTPESKDEEGNVTTPYSLNYNSLFTYAIAAIKEQQLIIEDLQDQINNLK